MNELIILLAIGFATYVLISAKVIPQFFHTRVEKNEPTQPAAVKPKWVVPEDSTLRRHFLTHLRSEIENDLAPSLIDPALRHYYEASIAAEFQKRLSEAE